MLKTPAGLPETPTVLSARTPSATSSKTLLFLAFGAVYVVWGSTYLGIRIAIETIPPLLMAGIRHVTVGCILLPILVWKTGIRPTKGHWRAAAISGVLLLLAGNGGLSWAEQTVPSGVAALLVATIGLWMVLIDWLRPGGVRPTGRVFVGLLIGFLGMGLLVGPSHLGGGRINPVGATVLTAAAFAWACGSLYAKHGGMPSSPLLGVALQSLCGGAALVLAGILIGEYRQLHWAAISQRSWLGLVYLIFFGSGIGFTAYVYILKHSSAAKVATYPLVNPVVALFLGWLILGEAITPRTLLAAGIILTSVLLVITAPHKKVEKAEEVIPTPLEA